MSHKRVLACIMVLCFALSTFPLQLVKAPYSSIQAAATSADDVDWWPMFHHDLTHTGYSTSPAPTTNQTLWSAEIGDAVFSSPAVAGGMVYVGSRDGKVYALDAATGAQVWNYTTGDLVWSSPAVVDGRVYIGSMDNRSYCLDASTGVQLWNYTIGIWVGSSPAVSGGVVYVGSYEGRVYALNAATGAQVWNYTAPGAIFSMSSPAVAGGCVYVGSLVDGKVYALDAATGALVWSYTTGNDVYSSPAVAGGCVYVGSDDGNVYAFGPSSAQTYCVTIDAHCYTEGVDVSLPITEDGLPSGYDTPYAFNGLTGTHSFTVPDTDLNGHPFAYWDTVSSGERSPTLYVSGAGTHIAYYEEISDRPRLVSATPMHNMINLTWNAPISQFILQNYCIYRGTSPSFTISWFNPYRIVSANSDPVDFQDPVSDNSIYYYEIVANYTEGFSRPSDTVACARLESLKGVANELTGLNTLSVPQWWESISVQQNFLVYTGGQNPEYYWCQNGIEKSMNFPYHACGIMEIWGPIDEPWINLMPTQIKYDQPNPRVWRLYPGPSDTVDFISSIEGQYLVMENTYFGIVKFDLGLADDAYIYTITNNYLSTDALSSSATYVLDNFPPNFVVVGHPGGGIAYFNGGSGSVCSDVEIGSSWITGKNIALVNYYNIGQTKTSESSFNLTWYLDGSFSYQNGGTDEGVFFAPNFASQIASAPQVNVLTTQAKAIAVEAHCPVYIDVYDSCGRFFGFNSTFGEVEAQIPNAMWVSNQSIVIFDPNGTYKLVVTGTDTGLFSLQIVSQNEVGLVETLLNTTQATGLGETLSWVLIPTNESGYMAFSNNPSPAVGGGHDYTC